MAEDYWSSAQSINTTRSTGSGINNNLNQVKQENDDDYIITDKIYLYVKDPNGTKYQYLIRKYEGIGLEEHKDPKALIEYSNDFQDVHNNIKEYNSDRKRKVFDKQSLMK